MFDRKQYMREYMKTYRVDHKVSLTEEQRLERNRKAKERYIARRATMGVTPREDSLVRRMFGKKMKELNADERRQYRQQLPKKVVSQDSVQLPKSESQSS